MPLALPPRADADPLLADLTEPQAQAVLHARGPLLVLAAAGSGKTRVITRRIAHLVRLGVPPWRILALTFTNKAALEMRSRVESLLGGADSPRSRGLTVSTFHALGARLLRRYAPLAARVVPGLRPDYSIYDTADQSSMMKRTLERLGLSSANWPPRSVLAHVSHAKNRLEDAAAFGARAGDFHARTIAKIYASYESAMRAAGALDFDDLLVLTARMLRDLPEVRDECRARWTHLLIDEYQDTNHAQLVIARLLAGESAPLGMGGNATEHSRGPDETVGEAGRGGPNICVVGDPDQSIYAWRGADISNILEFETHYPDARVIALGENFRSRAPILAVADGLIRRNIRRKHKPLFTRKDGGRKVEVIACRDERHEAAVVLDWIRAALADDATGGAWKNAAVFYRTNALSRVMEDALRDAGVPYVVARGTAFFDREEVRDALAYLRVLANPADSVSLERVLNKPARGISAATQEALEAASAVAGTPLLEACRRAAEMVPGLAPKARAAVERFVSLLDGWTDQSRYMGEDVTGSLADLVGRVVRESGLEKLHASDEPDPDSDRVANLRELVSSALQFEEQYDPAGDAALDPHEHPAAAPATPPLLAMLRAYLERVSLVADADAVDPARGAVTLMTLHAAKGLEFPVVAVIGLEENLLPHARAQESDAQLEEERRLAFVGITRAMERLLLTTARTRSVRGVPERTIESRFLQELPDAFVERSDQSAVGGWGDVGGSGGSGGDDGTRWHRDRFGPGRRGSPAGGDFSGPTDRARSTRPGTDEDADGPSVGQLVRHPQFGVGRVLAVSRGGNATARIEFQAVGLKTLVLQYARLEPLD
ncbi:MAG: UvrD-helicase domain-containing protein [Phycisphaerae bacterium]|nr:UvrD-helicase domain-containing protein [Phycisphaerae bacterium]